MPKRSRDLSAPYPVYFYHISLMEGEAVQKLVAMYDWWIYKKLKINFRWPDGGLREKCEWRETKSQEGRTSKSNY